MNLSTHLDVRSLAFVTYPRLGIQDKGLPYSIQSSVHQGSLRCSLSSKANRSSP